MITLRSILIFLMLAFGSQQVVAAGNCVSPGVILDVPTPGFLRNGTPNLYHRFDQELIAADLVSFTASRLRIRIPMTGLPGDSNFKVVHVENNGGHKVVANARTCNDWGGDLTGGGDGEGEGGEGEGSSGGGGQTNGAGGGGAGNTQRSDLVLRQRGLAPGVPATRNEVAAPSGGPEYLIVGSASEVTRAQVFLPREGVSILRSSSLGALGIRMSVLDLNGAITIGELRSVLAQQNILVTVDKHTVYGAAAGATDFAGPLVGIENPDTCRLSKAVRIGIIDGPIDTSNPALANVPIFTMSALNERERVGSTNHATAIAGLIAGTSGSNAPAGLAQGAEIFAVTAFSRSGARDVARLENIAKGLDWMLLRHVDVVNMSMAGPYNVVLEQIIKTVSKQGLILVASTGNGRQDAVSYPASDPLVFAITAVDADKRLYRKANFGEGVDFAAPGVDLLVAGRRGASVKSGTSYASAIATALIAQEISNGTTSFDRLMNSMRQDAEDLGEAGFDPKFGWGLMNFHKC